MSRNFVTLHAKVVFWKILKFNFFLNFCFSLYFGFHSIRNFDRRSAMYRYSITVCGQKNKEWNEIPYFNWPIWKNSSMHCIFWRQNFFSLRKNHSEESFLAYFPSDFCVDWKNLPNIEWSTFKRARRAVSDRLIKRGSKKFVPVLNFQLLQWVCTTLCSGTCLIVRQNFKSEET